MESLFQNRVVLTSIIFAVLATMVAYKTVHTEPFPDGLQGQMSKHGLELAHHLLDADSPTPEFSSVGAGYPIVIATIAHFDPNLKPALSCDVGQDQCDPGNFTSLFAVQYGLALVGLGAVFLSAFVLSRSWGVAVLTLIFAFIAGSHGALAGLVSPLIWQQTLMLLFLLALALAATRDDMRLTLAAGVAFGLTALFSPHLFIAAPFIVLSFGLLAKTQRLTLSRPYTQTLTLIVGMAVAPAVVRSSPWSVELVNTAWDYVASHLVQRLPMNTSGAHWTYYLIATPGVFVRGLWVGTPILTVLGLIHLPSLLKFSREDARLGPTLLVAVPILSLVVINTLLTANRPEYNVGLVFLLTYATAYLIGRTDVRRKFWADQARANT